MKNFLKRIVTKIPFAGAFARRLYRRRNTVNVTRKVKGGNSINYEGAKLSSVIFDIEGENSKITIGENCSLSNFKFYIRGNNHLVLIYPNCIFRDGGEIWIEDSDCSLIIKENSTFEKVHLALTEPKSKIFIGRDCMFANDIDVRTGDSHSIISQQTGERINFAKDISIGKHVWVAAHCIILKGANIADNSIVATGSVVTKSFEKPGIIIGGNPAIQLKEGVNWLRERI